MPRTIGRSKVTHSTSLINPTLIGRSLLYRFAARRGLNSANRERPATKLRDLRHFWRISLFARHHLPYGDSRRRSSDALRLEKPRREYRPDGGGRQKEHASQPGSDATPVPMTIKIRTLGSAKCFFERTTHTNTQARAAITICYRGYQKTLWLTAPLGGAISLPRTLRELTHEEGRMFPRPSFASGLGS